MPDRNQKIQSELEYYDSPHQHTIPERQHFAHDRVRARLKDVLLQLNCTSAHHLLDIGIGTGLEYTYLRAVTPHLTGVDLSLTALRVLKRTKPALPLGVADACNLPFADNTFDYLILSGVLHHFIGQGELSIPLKEAYRVIKPTGWLITVEPNLLFFNAPFFLIARKIAPKRFDLVPHERPMLPAEMCAGLEQVGFNAVDYEAATYAYNRFPLGLSKYLTTHESNWLKRKFSRNLGWWTLAWGQK